MSRIKTANIHSIALQVFRDYTESVMAELRGDGQGREDFTRRGVYVFTCDGEEFVAYHGYHVMDTRWSDEIWERFPRATANRVHDECRAILDACYTPEHIAAQRSMMDAFDREQAAWDVAQKRTMNARLPVVYPRFGGYGGSGAVTGTGRIVRLGRGGRIVFQFVSECDPEHRTRVGGSVVEVIESEDLFALREIVTRRMPHAPRSQA